MFTGFQKARGVQKRKESLLGFCEKSFKKKLSLNLETHMLD
jgi:hypothetical protein